MAPIATQRLAWLFLISRELGQRLQAATLAIHGDALNHGEAESRADGHQIEKGLLAPLKKNLQLQPFYEESNNF